ncbi:recombinase family protein [Paenibacillus sp. ISL-20]|uniref:recombinase family protein n=1 Tax=Paenibacillus sp. ISL-20 TaxID=2819163 RepID=UPI001BE7CDF4|nr:recombinase family protein [Paenibacillus sp. ISL-20]MBT2760011.1 recombinase family protein [Paenibacillus sp. ISL-20]
MKACIYARKSTNKLGQNETIDNQIGICKFKAKEYGLDVVDIKTDTGTGTDDINRPEVKSLIQLAIEGKFQCVIMKGISRFYRDTEKGLGLIKTLDRNGIRVITIEEGFDSKEQRTGTGKLDLSRITMYLMFAEMESKKTADRVKFQQMEKARKGQWNNASKPPFGYRYNSETKKLEVDLVESEIVRLIFNLYEEGYGIRSLTNYLEGENNQHKKYKSPNDRWTIDLVAYILKNRSYVGDVVYNQRSRTENVYKRNHKLKGVDRDVWVGNTKNNKEEWVVSKNAHEAIITREQFKRVETIQKIKSKNKGIRREFSLFAGIAKCGICKSGLSLKKNKINKHKSRKSYYYCVKYIKYGKSMCGNHRIEESVLEQTVISHMLSLINDEKVLNEFMDKHKNALTENNSSKMNERTKIESSINSVTNKMDMLLEKNMTGAISDLQFKSMNLKYSNELESLTNQLEELVKDIVQDQPQTEQSLEEHLMFIKSKVTDYWNMDKEAKRAFILQTISEVVLHDDDVLKVDIEYHFGL